MLFFTQSKVLRFTAEEDPKKSERIHMANEDYIIRVILEDY